MKEKKDQKKGAPTQAITIDKIGRKYAHIKGPTGKPIGSKIRNKFRFDSEKGIRDTRSDSKKFAEFSKEKVRGGNVAVVVNSNQQ